MERILVIDDDVELCHLVGEYLRAEGFAIEFTEKTPLSEVERRLARGNPAVVRAVKLLPVQ